MYLDSHQYKIVSPLKVNENIMPSNMLSTVFSRLPQKYSLRREMYWNTTKGRARFRCRHRKIHFCYKTPTFVGIKSQELFLPKRNRNKVLQFPYAGKQNAVLFYASLTNYIPLKT